MKISVSFTTRAEDLGSVLIDLAGRVQNLNYEVEVSVPHDKNRPRGLAVSELLNIIEACPGVSSSDLLDAYVAKGFARTGAQKAIVTLIKKKAIKRKKIRGRRGFQFFAVKSGG